MPSVRFVLRCAVCGTDLSFPVRGADPLNEAAEVLRAHAREIHGLDVPWPDFSEAHEGLTV